MFAKSATFIGGINFVFSIVAFRAELERADADGTKPATEEGRTQATAKREKESFMMNLEIWSIKNSSGDWESEYGNIVWFFIFPFGRWVLGFENAGIEVESQSVQSCDDVDCMSASKNSG